MHRAWLATRLRPGQRPRARGAHGARRPGAAGRGRRRGRSSRWTPSARCWWPSCSSSRPRPCGWWRATCARCSSAPSRWRPPRGCRALLIADSLDIGPGPVMAVLGGVVFALVRWRRCAGDARARPGPRRAATRPARRASRASRSRSTPARPPASSGPTAAARRRCSARCSASCPCGAARSSSTGRPAYVPQTDHARLDFPVSALDVALMGAYGRTPLYRRLGRGERAAAAAALDRVGLADRAGARFGDAVRRPAPARADRPRARAGRAGAAARRAAVGRRRAERRAHRGGASRAARRGPRAARGHPRRRAGARASSASCACTAARSRSARPPRCSRAAVLQETYGDELVVLEGGRAAVNVGHHHH